MDLNPSLLSEKTDIKDYLHLYLGCEIIIEKSSYWCVHEFDYHKGEKRLLIPSVLTWVNNSEMIVKPILRPLSSMTEEEREEVDELICRSEHPLWVKSIAKVAKWYLDRHFDIFQLIDRGLALSSSNEKSELKDGNITTHNGSISSQKV